ncbi:MAG: hypothetical protein ACJAW8_000191 [Oleispira sp.]|jgi:hypothetical protein
MFKILQGPKGSFLGVFVANMGGMDAELKATGRYLRRFAE